MKKLPLLCLALAAAVLATGCPTPDPEPVRHISFTVDGNNVSFVYGAAFINSLPHGVSNPGGPDTGVFACSEVWAGPPTPQYVIVYFDGLTTGASLTGLLGYWDNVTPANNFTAPLLVDCTTYGADEAGLIIGTFTGAGAGSGGQIVTSGSFDAERHDAAGLP